MDSGVVQSAYVREVYLSVFGETEPFGKYDREEEKFTLLNKDTMGSITWDEIWDTLAREKAQQACALYPFYSSTILFGVPRKVFDLRRQWRDDDLFGKLARDGEEKR